MNTCPCGAPIKYRRSKRCWNCHLENLAQRPIPPMQRKVFDLFLAGRSQKETAFALQISEKTASSHKLMLMKKLNVPNDVELVLAGVRLGYVPGYAFVQPIWAALEPLAA